MNKFIHIGSTILAIDEIVCVECQTKSEINLDELDRPERKITGYKIIITLKSGSTSTIYFSHSQSDDKDNLFVSISKKLEAVIV